MRTVSITANTYTAWQLLSRQYLTDASAFKSSSRVVRLKESLTLMVELCGQGMPITALVGDIPVGRVA
jgi:hypothetical protein